MATFREVREGIAANLSAIADLQVSAWVLAAATPPAVDVFPLAGEYDKAFQRGLDEVSFTVRVLVGAVSDIGSQQRLDAFLDPFGATSIKAAVESDLTLGGKVRDLRVIGWSAPKVYEPSGGHAAGNLLLGCEWRVDVYMDGS